MGSIHCVEWIKKKLGSSTMKGGTPVVCIYCVCLRRVSRMAENRSQSSWPNLHCAQGLLEKSEELCVPHRVAWKARFPVSPEFISEEGIVGVKNLWCFWKHESGLLFLGTLPYSPALLRDFCLLDRHRSQSPMSRIPWASVIDWKAHGARWGS